MHIINLRYTVFGVFIFVLLFSFFAVTWGDNTENSAGTETTKQKKAATVLFTGDIMLGRVVESLMDQNGPDYPFRGTLDLLRSTDVTVGNFEGAVPQIHQKTRPYTFRFSVKDDYVGTLHDVGFDLLSLANNHAYDFGSAGFQNTQETCSRHGILCFGNPRELAEYSTYVQAVNGHTIGYLFLNAVFSTPDYETLTKGIEMLHARSDFVAVYVHWGNEYELTHSDEQMKLAHIMVDAGADVVVGHHPHVVQDFEIYNNALIVYSLGNFVFDQYFSEEVMEGAFLGITLTDHTVRYEFIGVTSKNTKSQPILMTEKQEERLFARVLKNVDHNDGVLSWYRFD